MTELKPLFNFDKLPKKMTNSNGLTSMDVISVDQFDPEKLAYIFARAREMREMVRHVGGTDLLKGYVLACLFYEPSTRSRAMCGITLVIEVLPAFFEHMLKLYPSHTPSAVALV